MDTLTPDPADYPTSSKETLAVMPSETFVTAWRAIIGEPPAMMLNSRVAMIALLVASMPVAPLQPTVPAWNDDGVGAAAAR